MKVVADTTVFVDAAQKREGLLEWLESNSNVILVTSPVVLGELLALGRRETVVRKMLEGVELAPMDEEVGTEWGRLTHRMLRDGNPVPANNLWIAATALTQGLSVLTRDQGFQRVPELEVLIY